MTTASVAIPRPRRSGISDTSIRIGGLLSERSNVAQWWVDLTSQLDELSLRLMAEGGSMWQGLRDQLTKDAPHMSAQVRRIDGEQEELEEELIRVRVLAGEAAGDERRLRSISQMVRDLLGRVRRLEEHTTQALYDAYERDLGGEAA
jgi:predicted  nucleic acid-binding Zn-ribbon protein